MKAIILCGLPGSGKSTIARSLGEYICSADDYFMQNGIYNFDPKKLSQAHQACKDRFLDGLIAGIETVIVDNTNTSEWAVEYYVNIALQFGYEIEIIAVGNTVDIDTYVSRNVHGVPKESIERMASQLDSFLNSQTFQTWGRK